MYQRYDKQYDSKTNLPPERVFRQELITWAETDNGFVRTVLTRYFGQVASVTCTRPNPQCCRGAKEERQNDQRIFHSNEP